MIKLTKRLKLKVIPVVHLYILKIWFHEHAMTLLWSKRDFRVWSKTLKWKEEKVLGSSLILRVYAMYGQANGQESAKVEQIQQRHRN